MNDKDLLVVFNGINGRQAEDHDRIEALERMLTTLQYQELDDLVDHLQAEVADQLRRVQRFSAAFGETPTTTRIEYVLRAVQDVLRRLHHDDDD